MWRFQDLTAEELQDVVTLQNDHAFTGELFLGTCATELWQE